MPDRRVALLVLGIPAILVYGTLAIAQMRSARAMSEFTHLQKDYPPDSMKKPAAEIQRRKMNLLALAERMAPDNAETAFQTSLLQLVRAETESLQPEGSSSQEGETNPKIQASLREGLRWIDRAILLNPGYAEYSFVKATILQNVGNAGEKSTDGGFENAAADLLRRADSLDPYKPSLHYRIGSFWMALGDRKEAREAFAVALTDSYSYARPVFDLLWSSVENAAELQDFVGDRPLSRALLGDFLWMHGYHKEAQEQFEKVEAEPNLDYRTGEALIGHYIRETKGEQARTVIARMQKTIPPLSLFYQARLEYFRGKSFFQEHRYQEAIVCYERSLALDPSVIQSHLELAAAYLEEGQPQKAIARWHFVLSHNLLVPNEVARPGEIHFSLGRAYEILGDRDRALAEYLRASSEDPGNPAFARKASEITRGL
ncbi:MAG: hypothetical protein DMH00_12045 [Acidobacteria bacterium]|nr:MAG: hypothetical protein DMH00_12045 [Acidobacteriota bacterium]